MCTLRFYTPSNPASTKHFTETILTGAYDIIVLRALSRYVFNPPTILSNNFISNPVNPSSFPQASRQWMATTLPSAWIMRVMLTAAYSPVRT